jgi:hypothetical protein
MSILNYTTKVPVSRTLGEITAILVQAKAQAIMSEYEGGRTSHVSFRIETEHGLLSYRLPCNVEGVFAVIKRDSKIPAAQRTIEKAERIAWRIVKDWLEAQMAMVEAKLAVLPQVMLPYMQTNNGETLYQRFEAKQMGALLTYGGGNDQ